MLNKIKQIFTKFIDFIVGEDAVANSNKIKDDYDYYHRKVLLIARNQSNLKDIKPIFSQLNHDCICFETIEQAYSYFYYKPRLIVVDFDKGISNESFSRLELFCKSPIIVFIDRVTAEKTKNRSIFLARSTSYSDNIVLVKKTLSAEQALSLFSEYLCGNATPIIKWE